MKKGGFYEKLYNSQFGNQDEEDEILSL
jgi:ATP-binding cassette subfamily B multidrug efflux pump